MVSDTAREMIQSKSCQQTCAETQLLGDTEEGSGLSKSKGNKKLPEMSVSVNIPNRLAMRIFKPC